MPALEVFFPSGPNSYNYRVFSQRLYLLISRIIPVIRVRIREPDYTTLLTIMIVRDSHASVFFPRTSPSHDEMELSFLTRITSTMTVWFFLRIQKVKKEKIKHEAS